MNCIELTEKQKINFVKMMKSGIYKELYERDLLTDYQLDYLLNKVDIN